MSVWAYLLATLYLHLFYGTTYLIRFTVSNKTRKADKDILGDWVDLEILEITFAFVREDIFN